MPHLHVARGIQHIVAGVMTFGIANPAMAAGQNDAAQPAALRFEVVSVKPNLSGEFALSLRIAGGRFTATNVPLKELIRVAYGVQDFQILGGPNWITVDGFDIVASMGEGGTRDRASLMLQTLLADRFDLHLRREIMPLPIYTLVKQRKDGALGPSLHASAVDCRALAEAARANGTQPTPPPGPGEPMRCGTRRGRGSLSAGDVTMDDLSRSLSPAVERQVTDQTGLSGRFDVELTWTPDALPAAAPTIPSAQRTEDLPSLFTAIQEQLGLKLEPATGAVDALVIESVNHPMPD